MLDEKSEPMTTTNAKPPTATPPREMTPDLPPASTTRRRPTNQGRGYATPPAAAPLELFAIGVSGRVRRNPSAAV